ncbi:MAG: sodium:solute symporter family protein [Xanthomonadales bacterium]|nr:sodium:solute symporter family protein [Gammaproteobacteria bacterium]NNL96246.1 sodium:solute symporter family protein [Xanthomonadales bacterium]
MNIYSFAILASVLVYIAIGNYAGRRVKKLEDYYVAGRRAPTLLIVGTLVASIISTNAFLGETGFVYQGQAGPYLLWPAIAATFYIHGALFFGRYLRRSRAITVADYFGQRFNSQRVQTAAGLTIIFGLGGYLLAVTQGAAYLLTQVIDISYTQALVVSWLSYTAFTMYSGTRGVILTDTLMFLLFSGIALVALLFLIHQAGGMSNAVYDLASLPGKPDLMSWTGIVGDDSPFSSGLHFALWNVTLALAWGMVYAVSPWQSSRYLIARDEHVVMRAACVAAVCLTLLEITLYFAGAVINLSNPAIDPPHEVMIFAARNLLPSLVGALLLAGIMAAALSSASTFLSLVGFSVSNDVFAHRSMGDEQMLRLSRLMMLAVGLVVLMIAFVTPVDLFWLTYFVGTLFASSWGPVALMSVWSRRITADAAYWGIISGFVFNAAPKALETLGWIELPIWLDPILLGGMVSLAVVLWVSKLGTVSRRERVFRMRLHRVPASETGRARAAVTARFPLVMVIYGLVFYAIFMVAYIRPYQLATGTAAIREIVILSVGPVLWIATALFAWRMIRRSYG